LTRVARPADVSPRLLQLTADVSRTEKKKKGSENWQRPVKEKKNPFIFLCMPFYFICNIKKKKKKKKKEKTSID
jgi:hypothetical protein